MTPAAPFGELRSVWVQLTGTLCNLTCRHCFNASGPRAPWLAPLDGDTVRRAIAEAMGLGARELYFTGGEPFLHPEVLELLGEALAVAPTTVLTNGTLVDDALADRLAALAAASPYSLEVRVSVDGDTPQTNDAVRGRGTFERALAAVRRLDARDLPPIVTATDLGPLTPGPTFYERLRARLLEAGVRRPRIKILPALPLGRMAPERAGRCLTDADLDGFDTKLLQCTQTRAVATGGVYACPILTGLPGSRLASARIADALGPAPLFHPACVVCHATGLTCANG
jgi:AdoMet-dependent heme synthase